MGKGLKQGDSESTTLMTLLHSEQIMRLSYRRNLPVEKKKIKPYLDMTTRRPEEKILCLDQGVERSLPACGVHEPPPPTTRSQNAIERARRHGGGSQKLMLEH